MTKTESYHGFIIAVKDVKAMFPITVPKTFVLLCRSEVMEISIYGMAYTAGLPELRRISI